MSILKRLSLNFFEKSRPNAPKNSLKKIKPFEWSNEKEVLSSKYKNDKIIKLPKE